MVDHLTQTKSRERDPIGLTEEALVAWNKEILPRLHSIDKLPLTPEGLLPYAPLLGNEEKKVLRVRVEDSTGHAYDAGVRSTIEFLNWTAESKEYAAMRRLMSIHDLHSWHDTERRQAGNRDLLTRIGKELKRAMATANNPEPEILDEHREAYRRGVEVSIVWYFRHHKI